jgi:hypothetical protein
MDIIYKLYHIQVNDVKNLQMYHHYVNTKLYPTYIERAHNSQYCGAHQYFIIVGSSFM